MEDVFVLCSGWIGWGGSAQRGVPHDTGFSGVDEGSHAESRPRCTGCWVQGSRIRPIPQLSQGLHLPQVQHQSLQKQSGKGKFSLFFKIAVSDRSLSLYLPVRGWGREGCESACPDVLFQWDVAASVLEVFYQLLLQHEVIPEDFVDQTVDIQGGGKVAANKSPGHTIMVHLLKDTAMLKMVSPFLALCDISLHSLRRKSCHFGCLRLIMVSYSIPDFVHHWRGHQALPEIHVILWEGGVGESVSALPEDSWPGVFEARRVLSYVEGQWCFFYCVPDGGAAPGNQRKKWKTRSHSEHSKVCLLDIWNKPKSACFVTIQMALFGRGTIWK